MSILPIFEKYGFILSQFDEKTTLYIRIYKGKYDRRINKCLIGEPIFIVFINV